MSDKPTIVLVHGFWGGAAHWGKVIVELSRKGHTRLRALAYVETGRANGKVVGQGEISPISNKCQHRPAGLHGPFLCREWRLSVPVRRRANRRCTAWLGHVGQ